MCARHRCHLAGENPGPRRKKRRSANERVYAAERNPKEAGKTDLFFAEGE
ncbi:hypothetical protein B4135_1843 [Caldibacillus debilis]|uniref:Uncharacterized protein n=1 Tax=Caldibacillus debilis TaxID=301148 RepID=A0A150M8J3_9BACI|nr:hypothetical protein B4135_1843 [Caldibacillus debilis]